MDVKLVVKKGTTRTRVVQLRGDETIVGRRADCDLRIESAAVSRRHCLIRIQPSSVSVEDLDSINGTFVNGTKVKGKQLLKPGDKLQIGPLKFTVQYEPASSKSKVPTEAAKPAAAATPPPSGKGKVPTRTRVMPQEPVEEDDELDVLPLVEEEDTSTALATDIPTANEQPSASLLEALDVSDNKLESSLDWHLPDSNELRDLLADMDDEKEKPRRPR